MKNLNIKKYIIIIICISFLSTISFFSFSHHSNDHIHEVTVECSQCHYINHVLHQLKFLYKLETIPLGEIVLLFCVFDLLLNKQLATKNTLITLKVRLDI